MPSNYPGSLDALTNPAAGDPLSSPSHASQHINANDAIEAIEGELGTAPSAAFATVTARLVIGQGVTDMRAATILSTTSTTFVNITGAAVTITTGARRALVTVIAEGYNSNSAADTSLDLAIDAARVGGTDGLVTETQVTGSADVHNLSFTFVTDVLTAAAHTFQLMMRVTAGTGSVFNSPAKPLRIQAIEIL